MKNHYIDKSFVALILVCFLALGGCGTQSVGNASLPDISPPETPVIPTSGFIPEISWQSAPVSGFSELGSISGKLVSEEGPLAGVTVATMFGESAVTGEDGTFKIDRVPPGTATIFLPDIPYDLGVSEVSVLGSRDTALGDIRAMKADYMSPSGDACDIEIYAYGLTDTLSWYGNYRVNCYPLEVKMEGLRGSNYSDYHYFTGSSTMDYFTFDEVPAPSNNGENNYYRYRVTVKFQAHYFDENGLSKDQTFEIRRYGSVYKDYAGHTLRGRVYLRSWDIPSAP